MKKICSKCKKEKDLSEFYDKGKENRKASYCKFCFNKYCKDRWKKKKIEAVQYKGGKCQECGYDKNYYSLGFHHREGEHKEYSWTKLRLMSWKKIKEELDKCDLVCSNCHGEIHEKLDLKYGGRYKSK